METLYALAGMFPNNDASEKSKLDTESMEAKPSAMPVSKESPMPTLEGPSLSSFYNLKSWFSLCCGLLNSVFYQILQLQMTTCAPPP